MTAQPSADDLHRGSMDLRSPDAYGRSFETVYDDWYDGVTDAEQTARFIAERHQDNEHLVLELGVGTGRLAEPLARRNLSVVGLDASMGMLGRGRSRSMAWAPVQASFDDLPFAGRSFATVLLAFNTVFNLTQESSQRRLFASVAEVMRPGGSFIVEALDVTPLLDGPRRTIGRRADSGDPLVVTATQLKRSTQQVTGHHLEVDDRGVRVRPWMLRWATPAQLDAMADSAGLRLVERCADWHGRSPDATTTTHISRYQLH